MYVIFVDFIEDCMILFIRVDMISAYRRPMSSLVSRYAPCRLQMLRMLAEISASAFCVSGILKNLHYQVAQWALG